MATYVIEVYELHSFKFEVEAVSLQDAVETYRRGEGSPVDNSGEYIGVADNCGLDGIREIETPEGEAVRWDMLERALHEED